MALKFVPPAPPAVPPGKLKANPKPVLGALPSTKVVVPPKPPTKVTKANKPSWTGSGPTTKVGIPALPSQPTAQVDPINIDPTGSIPGMSADYAGLFKKVLQAAMGLYSTPNPAAGALLNPGAITSGIGDQVIDPSKVGSDAGLRYDAITGQLNRNIQYTKNQNSQDLTDIGHWFDQAQGAQQKGAAANAAELAAQLQGSGDAARGFMDAIGGSSNPANAGVANAASIAQAGLRGAGLAQSDFDSNLATLIPLDRAQQLTNETGRGNQRLQTLQDALTANAGEKAGAVAEATDNAQAQKFAQLSSLANLKSNLYGNLFNEKQSLRNTKLGELAGLSNTVLGTALAPAQIQAANLGNQATAAGTAGTIIRNKGYEAQINQYIASNGGKGGATLETALPGIRQTVASGFSQKGGDLVNASGGLKVSPPSIKAAVANAIYGTQGWARTPGSEQFINSVVSSLLTPARVKAWDKAHGTKWAAKGGY